jgi:dTDP-4-dehydrorhamnose 3,5-epimerase
MSRFNLIQTPLSGLTILQRTVIDDHRGFFSRFYCFDQLSVAGLSKPIAQINHSLTSKKGTVRGLHFQHQPYAENKIVSCLRGQAFDVAVDIRKNSPTFLQWYGIVISDENKKSLIVPEGFAHGYQALSEDCELIYLSTANYSVGSEGGINAEDKSLSITWPLPITDLSEKDAKYPSITSDFLGVDTIL